MQKNKANETAKDVIKVAKSYFKDRINNITLFISCKLDLQNTPF